ncbi:Fur family ferric uptake transcriptional regulator [Pontibacter ummariensis]|uniref:Fur family transcriptional regulator, ferric uptake regulator n=1 Tax=Pontibacter ummariensis TaxID=1610492 RepID=A0A239DPX6_9BACT|nr:Fur family transcriptional regulator [Pontibacter ummariensis]PRY13836.1 Fur family ferric uptake transcriptional regulator [Pontibacter ummariensis]SNS33948.1 Fur family transcriptional regulator, ferric uptake regulator [Pontibacter ummariensis]
MHDKELESQLNERNIKPTAMRLLVLDFLLNQQTAVSLNELEASFHRADRITLYRTLKTFEEKGLVHGIEDGTGSVKYALCDDTCQPQEHQDLHVHFHCRQCAETYCLPKSRVPEIPLPGSFLPEEVNLVVKGVCGSCAEKNAMRLQAGGQ